MAYNIKVPAESVRFSARFYKAELFEISSRSEYVDVVNVMVAIKVIVASQNQINKARIDLLS